MKPTVITTGPGVIIATATASTNCWSFSQPYSFTTPPYKNGTIAKPLPKTNAPAFVKKYAICHSRSLLPSPDAPAIDASGNKMRGSVRGGRRPQLGGARHNH